MLLDPFADRGRGDFLDLADPLPRESERVSDLVESALAGILDSMAHREDDPLALGKRAKARLHRSPGLLVDRVLERRGTPPIGERLGEKPVRRRNRGIDRLEGSDGGKELLDFRSAEPGAGRDLARGRRPAEAGLRGEDRAGFGNAVHRNSDGPRFFGQRPADALLNPVGSEGGKTRSHARIESIRRAHEADASFLNHVDEIEPASPEPLRDPDHEPEVSLDEAAPGGVERRERARESRESCSFSPGGSRDELSRRGLDPGEPPSRRRSRRP